MPPRDRYFHGWGEDCHNPQAIVCTWILSVQDRNDATCKLYFDLVHGSSPIILGLDATRYANSLNLTSNPLIVLRRPDDSRPFTFRTYIAPGSPDKPRCIRTRVEILPRPTAASAHTVSSLLGSLHRDAKRDPRSFAVRVHRYTHVHPEQLKEICDDAGILDPALAAAIDNVDAACGLCAQHGRPVPSKKISLSHVNEAFNEEVQVDFTYATVYRPETPSTEVHRREKHIIMVLTDTGTRYTEAAVVKDRNIATIKDVYERYWLCRHGAPKQLSADDEYNRASLTSYLDTHKISFKARPTRRHNKLGIVERKNGTLKGIVRKLAMEYSSATMPSIISKATFLCNLFSGSQTLSSFQLARGYQPSLLGIPSANVPQDLLDAHTHQVATRALQRVLRSRNPNAPTPGMFQPGDVVWVWYATSKQNEDDRWIKATVVSTHTHYLAVRRLKNGRPCKGRPMKPAYEDVRIAPQNELAQELMECSLETALGYGDSSERGVDAQNGEPEDAPRNPATSLMAGMTKESKSIRKKDARDDIGTYVDRIRTNNPNICKTLKSDRARIVESIYDCIGSKQVSRGKMAFAPPWILDDAFEKEYTSNWGDSFTLVNERDVPKDANIITSHVVYKVKTAEDGTRTLKSRIVPHGNRDSEKDYIRKDSATAQLSIIRLLLSIVTFLGFRMGTADIKGAYLQSGQIQRTIYVRPPREWHTSHRRQRGALWKLTKLPYGIVEAGRQWQTTVEDWMITTGGLQRVFGLSQLFIRRDKKNNIVLIVAKVTDDFLVGGSLDYIHEFMFRLQERFTVGKIVVDRRFHFNGCEIEQDVDGNIRMSMLRYLDRLKPITLSRSRKKLRSNHATDAELKMYRALAGTLLYLGNGVLPQASFVVSTMQQRLSNLTVQHLIDANEMLRDLLKLDPWVTFRKPRHTDDVTYCTFSDASHPTDRDYGQTGIVAGLRITNRKDNSSLFHPIDWTSHKQSRVSYSSYGAEILAAATADDRGYYFKTAINTLFPDVTTKHELSVDSRCLFDTITTLHESSEYRLRPTVQRMRNSFEANELERMRWIPGVVNVADALTKRSLELARRLNIMCTQGVLNVDLDTGYAVDSALWK